MERRLTVGITLGDYNGIGAEVIIRTLEDERMLHLADYVVYGHKFVLSHYAKAIKAHNWHVHEVTDTSALNPKMVNVINCWDDHITITPG